MSEQWMHLDRDEWQSASSDERLPLKNFDRLYPA